MKRGSWYLFRLVSEFSRKKGLISKGKQNFKGKAYELDGKEDVSFRGLSVFLELTLTRGY